MIESQIGDLLICQLDKTESSWIKSISYHLLKNEMEVQINGFPPILYIYVPFEIFAEFLQADSFGKFYNEFIKSQFLTKKQKTMADLELGASIDLSKVNKDMLVYGKKKVVNGEEIQPIYLNLRIKYTQSEDQFGQNGMIVQGVPAAYRKDHKGAQGEILGNMKDFTAQQRASLPKVGEEEGTTGGVPDDIGDSLPF